MGSVVSVASLVSVVSAGTSMPSGGLHPLLFSLFILPSQVKVYRVSPYLPPSYTGHSVTSGPSLPLLPPPYYSSLTGRVSAYLSAFIFARGTLHCALSCLTGEGKAHRRVCTFHERPSKLAAPNLRHIASCQLYTAK